MTPFIDLRGASGAVYRFRLAQPDNPPNAAGNFVCVAEGPDGHRVVCCGAITSLAGASSAWREAVHQEGATRLYVRLNVVSHIRMNEHSDLVSELRPPLVISDPD